MNPAPVVLFVYDRPMHARQTLEALSRNDLAGQSDLHIYSDAARDAAAVPLVNEVRSHIRGVRGFRSVVVVEQEKNLGLAESIISGVSRVCGTHGRVIVVEDDLQTSPHFLRYMNDALEKYAADARVGSIHGYWYPTDRPLPETFFLRGASCWGWATWSRAWQLFERDGTKLLQELQRRKLERDFDLDGAIGYTKMLKDQIAGRNNSWAIRWHATNYLAGLLQLSPASSLVRNIGFDGTGTHCVKTDAYAVQLGLQPVRVGDTPVTASAEARAALIEYYHATRRSLPVRIAGRLRRMAGL